MTKKLTQCSLDKRITISYLFISRISAVRNIVRLVVFSGFLFVPLVSAYPPNPKNCCVYCQHDGQELCFWNDKSFLYMSIEPDAQVVSVRMYWWIRVNIEYSVKGYSETE